MSTQYAIEYLDDRDIWTYWYFTATETQAREIVESFKPNKVIGKRAIRAVKIIENKEILSTSKKNKQPVPHSESKRK